MRGLVIPMLLCAFVPGGARAATRVLKGRVILEDRHGKELSADKVQVLLEETGARDITDGLGLFRLEVSEKFQPGENVTLAVESPRRDWRLFEPLDGNILIPANPARQLIKLRLLPAGSLRFMTDARMVEMLKNEHSAACAQAIQTGEVVQVDMGLTLQDWARKYGLGVNEVRDKLDQWAARVEKQGEDTELLALAAFAQGQFSQASALLTQLARETDQRLERKRLEVASLEAASVRQHATAGDADYNAKDYPRALAHYEDALKNVSREKAPHHWLSLMLSAAVTHVAQAESDQGEAVLQHYAAARAIQDALLEAYPASRAPEEWARIQNSRANTLRSQGERAKPADAARLLQEAVEAYEATLEVRTRAERPRDWATTQNNLGRTLMRLAEQREGAEAIWLLRDSVLTYRAALSVHTRDAFPDEWAALQSNLGIALLLQSQRVEWVKAYPLRQKAVEACRAALEVRTRARDPQDWATTLNVLANALLAQAEQLDQEQAPLLQEAVRAYRAVLEVRTRQHWPQPWATAQSNLGNALWRQGELATRKDGPPLFEEAVQAYREALTVITREPMPLYWATVQSNLGNTLLSWSQREDALEATRLLEEAATAFEAVLAVLGGQKDSVSWQKAHSARLEVALALAEAHAASGDFEHMGQVVQNALRDPDLDPRRSINLRTLELVALLVDQHPEALAARVQALQALASREPEATGWRWSRQTLLDRVRKEPRLASFQKWLPVLLKAVNGQRRDELLFALEYTREALAPSSP